MIEPWTKQLNLSNVNNMTTTKTAMTALASASALSAITSEAQPAPARLVEQLRSADDNVRGTAWQQAGPAGAQAVGPVAALMTDPDFEVARSAKRALWSETSAASIGRPGS